MSAGDRREPPWESSPGDVTIRSYDRAATTWLARSWTEVGEDMADFIDRFAASVAPGPVLELGSGGGFVAAHVEARGVSVVRSDVTPAFIEALRAAGHEVLRIDARFDAFGGPWAGVLASAVLLHLTHAEFAGALTRLRAATRPGGAFAFTLKEGDGEEWTTAKIGEPRYFRYWREPELRRELTGAEWEVNRLDRYSFRGTPWLSVLATPAASAPGSRRGCRQTRR